LCEIFNSLCRCMSTVLLSSVQPELSKIDIKVQNLMFCPVSPTCDRCRPSPRFCVLTQRSAIPPTPDVANESPRCCERQSNYQIFPQRGNASARIFRPESPEHILRRRERSTVPVILGVLLTPVNSTVPIGRDRLNSTNLANEMHKD
jgi:hypothetical protein